MPQPGFDHLRERLLRAGVAPRHVRRYVGELRDHFDDLVREETAKGAAHNAAEMKASERLGGEAELADVMLTRQGVRSIAARYPWAVFGLGPVALVLAVLVGAVLIEAGVLNLITALIGRPKLIGHVPPEWVVSTVNAWNWLATTAAPLVIAAVLCVMGLRQRTKPAWIFTGIAIACVLGGFQEMHWADNGYHGELSLGSGLTPPFPLDLIIGGLYRGVITFAIAAAIYWYGARRMNSGATAIDSTMPQAAE